MTPLKRIFDIAAVAFLGSLLVLPFSVLLIYLLIREERPIFYVSERMRSPDRPFHLWKLRTMRPANCDLGVSGGDKTGRITPMGAWLRKYRADEIPQLWNVLKGDMSFVGPRPPLRLYTERFPDLYAKVLRNRPGVTGLATIYYHSHEDRLLRACTTAEETDLIYSTRCIPRKAALDLMYQRRRNLCMDIALMVETVRRVVVRRQL